MRRGFEWVARSAAIVCVAASACAGGLWETDYEEAKESAKAGNRYMLLNFSGSDWCGWCMRLDKEVFSRKDFEDYAEDNLVCVLVDSPRRKKLSKDLQEQNGKLKKKHKIGGYPTVVILSPDEELVGRTGYQEGGPEKYVEHLKAFVDPHREKHNIPAPTKAKTSRLKLSRRLTPLSRGPKPLAKDESREMREWTSRAGTTVNASVVRETGPYAILKREDGTLLQIMSSQLSEADREYIADLRKKESVPPEEDAP